MSATFTARQGQFLAYIHGFTVKYGVAPSFDEMARHFGVSSPSVNGMIKTLEKRSLLSRIPGVARSLRVLVPSSELPGGDFGTRAAAAKPAVSHPASVSLSPVDVAVAAAIAALDVLMRARSPDDGEGTVIEVAGAVRQSLLILGLGDDASVEVYRRIAAECARWSRDGRGIVIPQKVWTKT